MAQVSAAALTHEPVLMKVASFSPTMTPDLQGNMTAVTGSYTVNCGAVPCWIVDEREVVQAAANAVVGAVGAAFGAVLFVTAGTGMSLVGSLLCCIACCIACVSEEPDERTTKGGRLMDEESGEDA